MDRRREAGRKGAGGGKHVARNLFSTCSEQAEQVNVGLAHGEAGGV